MIRFNIHENIYALKFDYIRFTSVLLRLLHFASSVGSLIVRNKSIHLGNDVI